MGMMQRHPAPLVFLFPLLAPFAVGTLFASSVPALEPPLRGMTVSCPRAGAIWGSPDMAEAITELRSMGVDWVSIHPYAGIRRDGSMRIRPTAETGYLEDAVRIARDGGVELFWKPHLA